MTVVKITKGSRYCGQFIELDDATLASAVADEWSADPESDPFPYDNTPVDFHAAEPQSLLDFYASIDPAPPAPPEPPEPIEAPTLTRISPTSAVIGDPDVTLVCTGTGFDESCRIVFNGGEEPSELISDTEITTIVKPSTASGPWTVPVLVRGAGGDTVAKDFSFAEPEEPEEPEEPPTRSSR